MVHYPDTEQGQRELAEQVAGVHADLVNQTIKKLDCPQEQKVKLLEAVIKSAFCTQQETDACVNTGS